MTLTGREPRSGDQEYELALARISKRLPGGDSSVLGQILDLLGRRTDRALQAQLGGALTEADREDALSVALFRLWRNRKRFDPQKSRLDRWFYVLAKHAAIDLIRHKSGQPETKTMGELEGLPAPHGPSPSPEYLALRRDFRAALDELSSADKRILVSGLTESELSKELNMKPGTIRVRRFRSKEKLRKILRERGYDL